MSYVFLVPKIDSWSKNVISCEIAVKQNFEHFYSTKKFVFDFQGESLQLFWAILLNAVFITILEDFGSLLPARIVTVKDTVIWQYTLLLIEYKADLIK